MLYVGFALLDRTVLWGTGPKRAHARIANGSPARRKCWNPLPPGFIETDDRVV